MRNRYDQVGVSRHVLHKPVNSEDRIVAIIVCAGGGEKSEKWSLYYTVIVGIVGHFSCKPEPEMLWHQYFNTYSLVPLTLTLSNSFIKLLTKMNFSESKIDQNWRGKVCSVFL